MYTQLVSEYRFDPSEDPKSALFDLMRYGYLCIVDEHSNVIYSAGDCDDLVFSRSASKPIQALPVLKYGLDKAYGVTEKESVIFSGSHSGEAYHVEAVESILKKGGFNEEILCINPTEPESKAANADRISKGEPLRRIYHTCSGKHAGLLLLQKYLGGAPEDYWKVDTPVFNEVEQAIRIVSETSNLKIGVDGCGVPVFASPLKNMAIAYKNLACPECIADDGLAGAAIENARRITKYPEMVRGKGLLCTIMNEDPNIIAKGGANGVYGIGLKQQKLGIAFKFVDGTDSAWTFLVMEILRSLGVLLPEQEKKMEALHPRFFVNDNGRVVGERRCEVKISVPDGYFTKEREEIK